MTAWFRPKRVTVPRVRMLEISGVIDETFTPATTFEPLAKDRTPIVLDLGGVHRITSIGVRNWMESLKHLAGIEYFFIRCRPALVWQFNMVLRFGGTGRILSMFLPYVCSESRCGTDSEHLLDLRHHHDLVVSETPPQQRCVKCGNLAVFDEEPSSYFSHVAAHPPLKLPAAVTALLDDSSKPASLPLKIRKDVTAELTAVWLSGGINDNAKLKRIADGLDGAVLVVADEVHEVTPTALQKLVEVLAAESSQIYFARAPVALARALAAMGPGSHPPVVSMRIGSQCDACRQVEWLELDRLKWSALRAGDLPPCRVCTGTLIPFTEDSLDDLSALDLAPMPRAVASYLELQSQLSGEDAGRTDTALQPGSVGRPALEGYEILEKLGAGGMAEVMLARQLGLQGFNKLVAIKRILPGLATDDTFVDMFLREARIAAAISHANVVQIFDLKQSGNDYFIVMEYVPGWNLELVLRTALHSQSPMPIEIACRIVSDVCAGLHAAHTATNANGTPLAVVHRDVSPHNVLVSKTGAVKLTDFGIAKATAVNAATRTTGLKGKFLYMAPERFDGVDSDIRSDVFAAGLILSYCLTRTHPFDGPNEAAILERAVKAIVPAPSSLRADVPAQLDDIVAAAVARNVADRYQTAQELQMALEQFMTSTGRIATPAHLARWVNSVFASNDPATPDAGDSATEPGAAGTAATTPGFVKR